jgi:oligoribonuclease (3'-5' exoribonuclease)
MSEFVFAFLDCEFGGLDPELHDITEVALVLTDYRLAELSSGEWKIAARAERISDEAAAISGYDAEAWRGAPHVREVLTEMSAMMPAGKVVVPAGQNVRMDVAFLERAYRGCGIRYPFDYHVIDLASLFYVWSLVAGEPVSRSTPSATTWGDLRCDRLRRSPYEVSCRRRRADAKRADAPSPRACGADPP